MPKLVWLNGELMPLESATVSVADHAHLYGDGLFEGIRFYNRKVFRFDEHMRRLYDGCRFLGFEMTLEIEELSQIILDVCAKADMDNGYIRLNVTRGTGLGLDPKHIDRRPNVMVMVSSLNLYPPELVETGITLTMSPWRTIPADSLDSRVKCIGRYACHIMAKHHANRVGAGDALMLNHQGQVAEGTGNNIFVVRDGILRTPHPSCGILQGITRDVVLELARELEIPTEETVLTPMDVFAADECFFTGTATEVMPAVELDGRPIGTGRPGPISKRLVQAFHEATRIGTPFGAEAASAPSR